MDKVEKKFKARHYRRLARMHEKLKGTEIMTNLHHLATSDFIVRRNYQELLNGIKRFEADITIMYLKNVRRFEFASKEITRMLHNYLASIKSLIDHTTRFKRNLKNPKLDSEYLRKVRKLTSNECAVFIKQFRNYIQHYELPLISAHLTVTRKKPEKPDFEEDLRLLLNKEDLLKWDKWNQSSKNYINKFDELKLGEIFEEYEAFNNEFYEWFYNNVIELYKNEIEELRKLEMEMEELEKDIFPEEE